MRKNVDDELENNIKDHNENKLKTQKKNQEKLKIYDNEITRLKNELIVIQESVKTNFDKLLTEENDYFNQMSEKNLIDYNKVLNEIEEGIRKLVLSNCFQEEAIDSLNKDYKKLIEDNKSKYENIIKTDEILLGKRKIEEEKTKIDFEDTLSNTSSSKNLLKRNLKEEEKKEIELSMNINNNAAFKKDSWIEKNF